MKWWLSRDPELERFIDATIALLFIVVIAAVIFVDPTAVPR